MDYKKIRDKLKVIVSIILLVWAIYVMVEIIRIKNNLSSSPLIVLTEESTYNDYTYYSLGFKTEYIYKDGKKINYTIGIDGADNYTVDITEENGNFTITTTVVPEEDENITDETEEIDEVDDSDDETPTPQPSVPHKHHVSKHVKPDKNATGNPIALLLLALFIPLIRRKQN